MKKIITILLLTLIIATNASAGITSAYKSIKYGDSVQAVEKKIGVVDNGPYAYRSPIGIVHCGGWIKERLVVCIRAKVVWVGQTNSKGNLIAQKGNKKLFVKLPELVDLRLME